MKVPKLFTLERDLTDKVNAYLQEGAKPTQLYDHVKKLYGGFEHRNIVFLYGPHATGKTFTSNKTKEALSDEYSISHISLSPMDAYMPVTKEGYFDEIVRMINASLSANKKVYIDIIEIEKFNALAQEALNDILEGYRGNSGVVFIFQSSYTASTEPRIFGERKKPWILKGRGEDRILYLEFRTKQK